MTESSRNKVVIVVDDDALMRRVIRRLIAEQTEAEVFSYGCAIEFLSGAKCSECFDPDFIGCIVTDYKLPGMCGLEFQKKLIEIGIDLPIIMVSGKGTIPVAVEAMGKGAVTYLQKPFDNSQLVQAVNEALAACEERHSHLIVRESKLKKVGLLSVTELEIARHWLSGALNKEIAKRLDLSLRSVERGKHQIKKKLGCDSQVGIFKILGDAGIEIVSQI